MPGKIHQAQDNILEDENGYVLLGQPTLAEVARGMRATMQAVESLHSETRDLDLKLTQIHTSLIQTEETVKKLNNLLTAGDPNSVMIRLTIAERDLTELRQWRHEQEHGRKQTTDEAQRFQKQLRISITTSILSFVSALVVMFISLYFKN